MADHRGDGSTGRVAGNDQTLGIDVQFRCIIDAPPDDGCRIIDSGWEGMFRRKSIADRDYSAAARVGEHPTESVVRRDVAEYPSTTVEVNDARQSIRIRIARCVNTDRDRAIAAGRFAILNTADRNVTRIGYLGEPNHRPSERAGRQLGRVIASTGGNHV